MGADAHSFFSARLVALGIGAGFSLLTLAVGPMHQTQFGHDVFAFLDACQRIALGQVVHADFESPLGAGAFAPFVAMMRIVGTDVVALPAGVALCLAGFTIWAWTLARPRFSPWCAAGFAIFVGLLGGTGYTLDFGGWERPSYAMFYNRIAWAAFTLTAVECLIIPHDQSERQERAGAFSSGAAYALMALVKVNFALVSALMIALACVLAGRWRAARLAWLAAGAAMMSVVIYMIAPFSVLGYAREWLGLSRIKQGITFGWVAERVLHDNAAFIAISAVVLLAFWFWPALASRRAAICASLGLLIVAGLLISLANCQFAELPVFPLAALLGFELVARAVPAVRRSRWEMLALLPLALFLVPHFALPVRELAWQRIKQPQIPAMARIEAPPAAKLAMTPWPGEPLESHQAALRWDGGETSPFAFAQWVNDGLALLRRHVTPTSRVLSMDWANPFSFALHLPPPRGDHIAWHWGRTVGDEHHVAPETLLAEADFVMVPRFGAQPASIAAKLRVYGPLLRERFAPIAKSEIWTLWRRRPGLPVAQTAGF